MASAQGVGASQASASGNYQQFADAIMAEQQRMLDPRFQAEESAFRQRMVNQGIQEGTEAFDNAWDNYSRTKNDAYSSARNQAWGQSLFAQNQDFSQSHANAQLSQQAQLANAANALQAQGLSQQDRQFGASLGQSYDQMGLQNDQFGRSLQTQLYGMGENARQFDAGLA